MIRRLLGKGMAGWLLLGIMSCPVRAQAGFENYLAPSGTCGQAAEQVLSPSAAQKEAMQCLINYARAQDRLKSLKNSTLLNSSAAAKADDLVRCGVLSHTACGRDFDYYFRSVGYLATGYSWTVGENLASAGYLVATPRLVMRGWLNSDTHRQVILKPVYDELGLGFLPRANFKGVSSVWVSHFGVRSPSSTSSPALKLKVLPNRAKRGARVRVKFYVSSARPLRARIRVAGQTFLTSSSGTAYRYLRLARRGTYTVVANRAGYQSARKIIRVF